MKGMKEGFIVLFTMDKVKPKDRVDLWK